MSHEKVQQKVTDIAKESILFIQQEKLSEDYIMEFWLELMQIAKDQIETLQTYEEDLG